MKKLINQADDVVSEMIEGFAGAHPEYVEKLKDRFVMVRKQRSKEKVVLVSGGGSGHEPAHVGFIGEGMLDAAVPGSMFTSPTPDQIYEGAKAVSNGKGVLFIVKNYTGDVMNFDMAKELLEMDGIHVETVIVNDDVAVEDSTYTTGRRGIAGTVFVHKIAGAKAEEGAELSEVKEVAEKVIQNVRSMGMAISPCTIPSAGKPNFNLDENEMEIGIGIHGEPGTHREQLKTVDEIVEQLLSKIMGDLQLTSGDEAAVLVNGLGATPLMELYIANRKINEILKEKNIKIAKTFVGEFMTSIDMAGFSISLLKLDQELKALLYRKADTPAFKIG